MVLLSLLRFAARPLARFAARGITRFAPRALPAAARFGRTALRKIPIVGRLRKIRFAPKVPRGAIPRISRTRRIGGIVGRNVLGAGAFIAATSLFSRFKGRGAGDVAGGVSGGVIPGGNGRGIGAGTDVGTGGNGMGLLTKLGIGAAGLGGLFAAEKIAERLGVRGGAGFIGRRPAEAQAAAMGLPFGRRRRGKRLMITKPEIRAMRSVKSKLKRISKVISPFGWKVVRKVPGHEHVTRHVRKSVR